jgi:hypothetical protein
MFIHSEGDAMLTRREFHGALGASVLAATSKLPAHHGLHGPEKRLAIVTNVWTPGSHAWHMATRFLVGYPLRGKWHLPLIRVVSAFVDQKPENDLSQARAEEFGFPIYPTIAEALRCGGDKLAVDAILHIGEHGDYEINEIGQKLYPRYEFFKQIEAVFREDEWSVPVFNDKHLSWNFNWAQEMVNVSRELGFPYLAGSSLPVTWRMPSIEMPWGAEIEEAVCVAYGPVDIYDFHALETMQCMLERRRGGETGVVSMQALRGDAVWEAMENKAWAADLFKACLSRSQTLAQQNQFSHRFPQLQQMKELVETPIAYQFEYADGLKATMLLMNGLVRDFSFAARLRRQTEPLSTLFYLPPNPNVVYSGALMANAEQMFMTGKAPYPIERTLLTSGLVQAGLKSLAAGQIRMETPHLDVQYRAARKSTFWRS